MDNSQFWYGTTAADLGEPINQSLRFSNNQRLVSANSRPTGSWTFSFWYKPAAMYKKSSRDTILRFNSNYSYQMGNPLYTGLSPYGCFMTVNAAVSGVVERLTNGSLNDTSAWYHVVLISESNTTRCYVNGVKQDHTGATPEGSSYMTIGSNSDSGMDDALEGYLAEVIMLDGTVVGHTTTDGKDIINEFGRYNEDNVWVPKKIEFTASQYGAKGFRLQFNDTSNIGDDSAPTGTGHASANDFTATGFTTTAISTSNFDNDVDYKDTPTSNYSVLASNAKKNNGELVDAGLGFHSDAGSEWRSALSSQIIDSGKWYWEVQDNQNEIFLGVADSRFWSELHTYNGAYPGNSADNYSLGYYTNNGTKYKAGGTTAGYGPSGTDGATYMVAWDADTGTIWVGKNGTWNSSATQSEIEAGTTTNAMYTGETTGNQYRAIVSHAYTTASDRAKVNFGQRPFQYTQPSGYKALESNNYPEPTIKKGNQHFGVLTYAAPGSPSYPITINGSGGNNGSGELDFGGQPDLVWIKMTNGTQNHIIFDTVRGKTKSLRPSQNIAEVTNRSNFDFTTNGFIISAADGETYQQNDSYAAFCWKGGGTAVSNSNGSETSSVSANTTAGFSIVKWTPDDAAGTVGHGLSQAPEMILLKGLDSSSWYVYHHANGATHTHYASLSTDTEFAASSAIWNNTAPTSTVFSVGSVGNAGRGGADAIAYCWHGVEGFSKFGTYRGTGSDNGAYIPCGFKPAFVMIKGRSNAGNWNIYNSATTPSNPADKLLRANIDNASEAASGNNIELLSNGFKCAGLNVNINETYHYVYMAFAEHPFGGENTPPATGR